MDEFFKCLLDYTVGAVTSYYHAYNICKKILIFRQTQKGANNNNKTRMQVAVEKGGFWAGKVVHGGLPQTTRYEYWRTFTTTMELDPRVQSRFRGSLLGWGSTVRLKARMSFIGSRTTKLEKGRRKGSLLIIITITSPCNKDHQLILILLLLLGNLIPFTPSILTSLLLQVG